MRASSCACIMLGCCLHSLKHAHTLAVWNAWSVTLKPCWGTRYADSILTWWQGAVVFVCGSAKRMPQEVASAFENVCMQEGGMSKADAAKYMKQLEMKGRYVVEAWS